MRVLNLMEHACDAGVPVALVGQGLGPLDDPGLQARAAQVLPQVRLIALRECRLGPQVLDRALPHNHLPTAADPAWLPTAAEGATPGTDPPT